ncbi:MAG: glycosyltransferase family 2 protein [Gammaproteobacteria bacterium]
MSEPPLVTIGLPAYNSERFIRRSIDSLLAQTFSDFVLVISDNASTDSTPRICQEYAESDRRVRCFHNPTNIGNPRNFNRLFELTATKYLKWSTTDDYWEPTFVERALDVMERDPTVALCYPKTYLIDAEGGTRTPYEDNLHLMQEDPAERFLTLLGSIGLAHQHLGLIRMSCLRRTHLLGAYVASDIALLAELTLYGKFYELPERLYTRTFHERSGSWKRGDAAHEARHYHSADRRRTGLKKWRGHMGLLSAVRTAPLPLRSKTRIYRHLLRRMFWDRRDLIAELTGREPARPL